MVTCTGCGKAMDKFPAWMDGVKVEFVCNNCPNRQTKNIAFVTFESEPKVAPKIDGFDGDDMDEEAAEED